MKITYTGGAHHRIITSADFPNVEDDFEDLHWTPGSWVDVPDSIAGELLERQRHEFVEYEDPKKRDHRTRDELYAVAQELEIPGRSSMDREELLDAVLARQSDEPGQFEGEPDLPIEVQSDTPDRAPEAEDQV
jgi:Rho termination factor, N-terminal domain